MTPFAPLVFIDTWALSSSLRNKLHLFHDTSDPLDMSSFSITLREENGKFFKGLKDWRALAIVLDRLRKLPLAAEHEFGEIAIRRVPPGGATSWTRRQTVWQRAHLMIVTNPLCFTFCGVAAQPLPIGMLTMVDASAPCCAVNWGEMPAFYMTMDFRRKVPEPSGIDETLGEAVAL